MKKLLPIIHLNIIILFTHINFCLLINLLSFLILITNMLRIEYEILVYVLFIISTCLHIIHLLLNIFLIVIYTLRLNSVGFYISGGSHTHQIIILLFY